MDGFIPEPTDEMRTERVFKRKLLGTSRNGEPSKGETNIDQLVGLAKQVFHNLKIQPLEVQPVWETGDLLANPDLLCSSTMAPKAIMDVVYCGFADNDRINGWSDLHKVDTLKALHYCFVYNELFHEWLPFFYIVFFTNGGAKVIDVKLTVQAIDSHKALLNQFRQNIEKLDVNDTVATFNQCVRCPLNPTCEHRVVVPKVEEFVVC